MLIPDVVGYMRYILAFILCLWAGVVIATEKQPLWELGAGVLGLNLPLYRGSEQRNSYVLPIPYFVYRGQKLKVGRQGIRGILYQSERWRLDLSIDGGVPVDSDDSEARRDMPDLDPMLELGPSIRYLLAADDNKQWRINLRLPLRAAYTLGDDGFQHRGWLTHPQVEWYQRLAQHWGLGVKAGVLFADSRYHRYYYDVAPQYVNLNRPAYEAEAGYSGARLTAGVSRAFNRWRFTGFMRYDNLSGTVFEDSPLVEQKQAFMVGFALVYIFKTSTQQVSRED